MPEKIRTWVGLLIIPLILVLLWFLISGGTLGKPRGDLLREFAVLLAVDAVLAIWWIRRSEGRFPWS